MSFKSQICVSDEFALCSFIVLEFHDGSSYCFVLFYENLFCKSDEDLFQNRFFGLAVTNDSSELCFLSPLRYLK